MISSNINELKRHLNLSKSPIILFGAGHIGELALYSCNQLGIPINFFCDSHEEKQGIKFLGIETITPNKLKEFGKEVNIFVSHNNAVASVNVLKSQGYTNVHYCTDIFESTDFSKAKNIKFTPLMKIPRKIEYYSSMVKKNDYATSGVLHVKSLDVQVTERCSLKCKNCCNLMQYYERPMNISFDTLFLSLDRFVKSIDKIDEFRLIGGDPFMNKELYKAVNKSKEYEKIKKVVIYTNAKIMPKGENLECLKDKKVILDISNYGGELANKHKEILEVLEKNNIEYSYSNVTDWQDSGRVLPFQKRTREENKRVFSDCCNRDTLSVLHGKLYRCPFSANAHNLRAVPDNKSDVVDLCDENISFSDLKEQIRKLAYHKDYLTACLYCNGRDYTSKIIPAAEQTRKPLAYQKF